MVNCGLARQLKKLSTKLSIEIVDSRRNAPLSKKYQGDSSESFEHFQKIPLAIFGCDFYHSTKQ